MATITASDRTAANTLLQFLGMNIEGVGDWRAQVAELLAGEAEPASRAIERALAARDRTNPRGLFRGGTGFLKEAADLNGDDAQAAIAALKATNRLVQLGRGRGKGLMVIDDTPVGEHEDLPAPSPARSRTEERPARPRAARAPRRPAEAVRSRPAAPDGARADLDGLTEAMVRAVAAWTQALVAEVGTANETSLQLRDTLAAAFDPGARAARSWS